MDQEKEPQASALDIAHLEDAYRASVGNPNRLLGIPPTQLRIAEYLSHRFDRPVRYTELLNHIYDKYPPASGVVSVQVSARKLRGYGIGITDLPDCRVKMDARGPLAPPRDVLAAAPTDPTDREAWLREQLQLRSGTRFRMIGISGRYSLRTLGALMLAEGPIKPPELVEFVYRDSPDRGGIDCIRNLVGSLRVALRVRGFGLKGFGRNGVYVEPFMREKIERYMGELYRY